MIKWLLLVLLVLVALVAVVALVGCFLPQDHVVSRSARYAQPPEAVFDVIHNVQGGPEWRPGLEAVEMLPPVDGRVRFREVSHGDSITMEIVDAARPTRMVTRIADPGQPFGGTWTFELVADGSGTRLTITERGEVYNVIFRALARFVIGHTATIDGYLKELGQKFGEPVSIASS